MLRIPQILTMRNILGGTSLFDLANQIWQYLLCQRIQCTKKREIEGESERPSEWKGSYCKGFSHPPSSNRIRSTWRSCSWLWSSRGSLETRLCSRSNHRIYVAWTVKGSAAAWGAHSTAPIHLCPTEYRGYRSCCLHLAAMPPWWPKGQGFCRYSGEITADIIQSYLCSLNPIYGCWGLSSEFRRVMSLCHLV